MEVVAFNRTLEQELAALLRGVSLECLVCGEFVLHEGGAITCPECGATLRAEPGKAAMQLQFDVQAG
jgi:Zn finger protein HypA/HybF involved in hydrogenase expression